MVRHGADEGRPGRHRLLPIASGLVAVAAVLAHLVGGAALMHVGLPAVLAYLGLSVQPANLGGGAFVVVIVAVVAFKLLVGFGARHWWRRRSLHEASHARLMTGGQHVGSDD